MLLPIFLLWASLVACTIPTRKFDCRHGIFRPTEELMKYQADNSAPFCAAAHHFSDGLTEKMEGFGFCDQEKNDIKRCLQKRLDACVGMLPNEIAQLKKLTGDVTSCMATLPKNCNRTQFYTTQFVYNFCVTSCLEVLPVSLPGLRFRRSPGITNLGRSRHSSEHKAPPFRLPMSDGSRERKHDHKDSSSSGSDEHHKFGKDIGRKPTGLAPVRSYNINFGVDLYVKMCYALDQQFTSLYPDFPASCSCPEPPVDAKNFCDKYDTDVNALLEYVGAYEKRALDCIKDLGDEFDKGGDADDFKARACLK